jgi:hypothetical protein
MVWSRIEPEFSPFTKLNFASWLRPWFFSCFLTDETHSPVLSPKRGGFSKQELVASSILLASRLCQHKGAVVPGVDRSSELRWESSFSAGEWKCRILWSASYFLSILHLCVLVGFIRIVAASFATGWYEGLRMGWEFPSPQDCIAHYTNLFVK